MRTQITRGNTQIAPAKLRFNLLTKIFATASLLCVLAIAGLLMWQYKLLNPTRYFGPSVKEQQKSLAANVSFSFISPSDARLSGALKATDIAKAKALFQQPGAFVGAVTNVRSSPSNSKVVLDFAVPYQMAVQATVKPENFSKFPDLSSLIGKKVFVSGVFVPHSNRAEIGMTEPKQLELVR